MPVKPDERLNSIPETAARLRCSREHVYQLIASGALESCDIATPGAGRSKTRVSDEHIAAFIKARTRKSKKSA